MRSQTPHGNGVLVLALSGNVTKFATSAKANRINNGVHASECVWPPLTVTHCQYQVFCFTLIPTSNVEEIHASGCYRIPSRQEL